MVKYSKLGFADLIENPECKEKFIVYGLVDPRDNEVRYIGKSCSGLERPIEHLYNSQLKAASRKNSWIKKLKSEDLFPRIRVLKICDSAEDVAKWEVKLIEQYKRINKLLLNMTDGGTGGDTGAAWKKWKPVVGKSLITGEEKLYRHVHDVKKDGLNPSHVVAVCKGKRANHMGYIFRYADSEFMLMKNKTVTWIKIKNKESDEEFISESVKAAAKKIGIPVYAFSYLIKFKTFFDKYEVERLC